MYCTQYNRREQTGITDRDAHHRLYAVQGQHGLVRQNRRHLFRVNPAANLKGNDQCLDNSNCYANFACNNF